MKRRHLVIKPLAALLLTAGIATHAQAFDPVLEWTGNIIDVPNVLSTTFQIASALPHKVTLTDNGFLAPFDFLAAGVFKTGGATMGTMIGAGSFVFTPPVLGSYTAMVAGDPGGFDGFSLSTFGVTVTPIPEPGTYAMMLAGLGLIGWMAKRRLSNG